MSNSLQEDRVMDPNLFLGHRSRNARKRMQDQAMELVRCPSRGLRLPEETPKA